MTFSKPKIRPCLHGAFIAFFVLLLQQGLHAQTPQYHEENYEIGVRSLGLSRGTEVEDDGQGHTGSYHGLSIGLQVYYVHRNEKHNFWRITAGGLGHHSLSVRERKLSVGSERFESELTKLNTSAELALGKELPMIDKPFFKNFRLRAGLALAASCDLYERERKESSTLDDNGNLLTTSEGISPGRFEIASYVKAMFQAQFRVYKACYVGLEWTYGPNFSFQWLSAAALLQNDPSFKRNSIFVNWVPGLTPPLFSVGYSF